MTHVLETRSLGIRYFAEPVHDMAESGEGIAKAIVAASSARKARRIQRFVLDDIDEMPSLCLDDLIFERHGWEEM